MCLPPVVNQLFVNCQIWKLNLNDSLFNLLGAPSLANSMSDRIGRDTYVVDSSEDEDEDVLLTKLHFKIVVLGDGAVGKTSVIRRFAKDEFGDRYRQTIGVDFFSKDNIRIGRNADASIQIWDIGGQQLGSRMLERYIFGSHAVLLVYDVTSYESYRHIPDWYAFVERTFSRQESRKIATHMPLIALVGNKADLKHQRMIREVVHENFAMKHDFVPFSVSARTGDCICGMFREIASRLCWVECRKRGIDLGIEMNDDAATLGVAETTVVKARIVNHPETGPENGIGVETPERMKRTVGGKRRRRCVVQ